MPDVFCGHCDTLITDRSSVVERDGKTFCCNNCATAFARAQEAPNESGVTRYVNDAGVGAGSTA